MELTTGQITMLGLFQEYDIKGTLSGKLKIYGHSGEPVDALGYMLQRLGYQGTGWEACRSPIGEPVCPYRASEKELRINSAQLRAFFTEIDLQMNQSRQCSIESLVFLRTHFNNEN